MWIPLANNFSKFRHQQCDNGVVNEIIVVNPAIFGSNEEMVLTMAFYDGYAIEKRNDNETPLIMLYPSLDEIKFDLDIKTRILEYAQGASETDITSFDSALTFGVLYKAQDLGVVWAKKPLCEILPGSFIVDNENAMFYVNSMDDTSMCCTLVHSNGEMYKANADGHYTLARCLFEWTVFFEPTTSSPFPYKPVIIRDIKPGDLVTDKDNVFKCISTTECHIIYSLLQGDADGYIAETNGEFRFCKCDGIWYLIQDTEFTCVNIKPIQKNNEYKVHMILGSEACAVYKNGDIDILIAEMDSLGTFITRSFQTEAEREAYLLGVHDHNDWVDAYVLSEETESDIIAKLETVSSK